MDKFGADRVAFLFDGRRTHDLTRGFLEKPAVGGGFIRFILIIRRIADMGLKIGVLQNGFTYFGRTCGVRGLRYKPDDDIVHAISAVIGHPVIVGFIGVQAGVENRPGHCFQRVVVEGTRESGERVIHTVFLTDFDPSVAPLDLVARPISQTGQLKTFVRPDVRHDVSRVLRVVQLEFGGEIVPSICAVFLHNIDYALLRGSAQGVAVTGVFPLRYMHIPIDFPLQGDLRSDSLPVVDNKRRFQPVLEPALRQSDRGPHLGRVLCRNAGDRQAAAQQRRGQGHAQKSFHP